MKELTDKEKALLANFKWNDEEESDQHHACFDACKKILECGEAIVNFAYSQVDLEHLNTMDMSFELTVSPETHELLKDMYDSQWSYESRNTIVEVIGGCLSKTSRYDDLTSKVAKMLPDSIVTNVMLFLEESTPVSVVFTEEDDREVQTKDDAGYKIMLVTYTTTTK